MTIKKEGYEQFCDKLLQDIAKIYDLPLEVLIIKPGFTEHKTGYEYLKGIDQVPFDRILLRRMSNQLCIDLFYRKER